MEEVSASAEGALEAVESLCFAHVSRGQNSLMEDHMCLHTEIRMCIFTHISYSSLVKGLAATRMQISSFRQLLTEPL